jgi:hypothetical protein
MFLLTDSTVNKINGDTGFYIMAWLPVVIIIVFALRGIFRKKEKE